MCLHQPPSGSIRFGKVLMQGLPPGLNAVNHCGASDNTQVIYPVEAYMAKVIISVGAPRAPTSPTLLDGFLCEIVRSRYGYPHEPQLAVDAMLLHRNKRSPKSTTTAGESRGRARHGITMSSPFVVLT
jgi:hypothetical protein